MGTSLRFFSDGLLASGVPEWLCPSCPDSPPVLQYDPISQYITRGKAPFLPWTCQWGRHSPWRCVEAVTRDTASTTGQCHSLGQSCSGQNAEHVSNSKGGGAPLRAPGSRVKGLSWQDPAGSTSRSSPPPSHLGPCMAGGCHTLEVAVQEPRGGPCPPPGACAYQRPVLLDSH